MFSNLVFTGLVDQTVPFLLIVPRSRAKRCANANIKKYQINLISSAHQVSRCEFQHIILLADTFGTSFLDLKKNSKYNLNLKIYFIEKNNPFIYYLKTM